MKKSIPLIIFMLIISWSIYENIVFGEVIAEKKAIKALFNHNKNVQKVVKMVSQKDFSACYTVYYISKNGEKYAFENVHIENNIIMFYKLYKTDSHYNWINKIETVSNIVAEQLENMEISN